ncbi:MAG: tRNA dihydrouridine synthase DusB [Candidatus Omnitrophica bacterium]|nr:tRNA dihydrouridine synthase DusB [Candidatus Omnitrophota bacterium]
MIKIGNVNIESNVLLAPMAGCTDLPFRLIAREHGAKFCFYEMVDSNSLIYHRHKTYGNLKTDKKDLPIAVQLLGSDPAGMLEAAERLLGLVSVSFIDVNCACPAKKVIKKRSGAHLLRDTPRLYDILQRLTTELPLPVTIKIRTGFDKKDDGQIVEMVKHCEDIGVSAIFVHGRLKTQGYAGGVDYGAIKKIKDAVRIPVFGSGNIFSGESARLMFDETGCDGILVARGALGNPWIFNRIEEYLNTGKTPEEIPLAEKKKALKKHLDYINQYKSISAYGKAGFMRKVAIWYLKSIPSASNLRARITRETKSCQDILKIVMEI